MSDFRYINGVDFEITPQVLYDTVFMSLPEFWNYYSYFLRIKLTPQVKDVIEGIWEDLKKEVIRSGVDRSLKRSDRIKLKTQREKNEPIIKVKQGRGRPKKS